MRIVFFGSPPFARPAFERLLRRSQPPVGLVTAPVRRAGRGRSQAASPLVEAAGRAGLPVLRPESAADPEFLEAVRKLEPGLGVVVSYGQILKPALLEIPAQGFINLHASLLPRWRGASPVQAAILAGDAVTGVCVQRVVERLDAGPVLGARSVAIGPREEAPSLSARLAEEGAAVLAELLDRVGQGSLPHGAVQDEGEVTVCRRLRREDARIIWQAAAEEVDRRVRAMAGWPVAETTLPDGGPLKILAGLPEASAGSDGEPGRILDQGEGILVQCGRGAYRIQRLQRPGRAAMLAGEFLRGSRLKPGQRLGEGGGGAPSP